MPLGETELLPTERSWAKDQLGAGRAREPALAIAEWDLGDNWRYCRDVMRAER